MSFINCSSEKTKIKKRIMAPTWLLICCLTLLAFKQIQSLPLDSEKINNKMEKAGEKAQEIGGEVEQAAGQAVGAMKDAFSRFRRDAEEGMDSEGDYDMSDEKPGFFDRAAKFVMEVLQKFLKWINSDSN